MIGIVDDAIRQRGGIHARETLACTALFTTPFGRLSRASMSPVGPQVLHATRQSPQPRQVPSANASERPLFRRDPGLGDAAFGFGRQRVVITGR